MISKGKLKNIAKLVVEQDDIEQNINDYSDEDFVEVFIKLFRPWIKLKHGDEVSEYPMSMLVKKYYDEFASDNDIPTDRYYGSGMSKLVRIGKELVRNRKYKLPNLSKKEFFTKKYKKGIEILIRNLGLPPFVKVVLEEERPYDVFYKISINFEDYIKSNIDSNEINNIRRVGDKLRESFIHFLGVTYGNPSHGHLQLHLSSHIDMVGEDEWVKKELNKKVKKEIKQLPGAGGIHMIKYERNYGKIVLKLIFKSHIGWSTQREVREKAQNLISELGYNPNIIEVSS